MNREHTGDPRAGFSLVELLFTMVVIGILAQIALPNYRGLTIRARAVDVVADIDVIEQAARSYQSDFHRWPSDSPAGIVPGGMEPYLPNGFSFTGEDFTLDWENTAVPGGLPGDPETSRILAVGVVTGNQDLANALVEVFGQNGWYVVGNSYIRIIERQ